MLQKVDFTLANELRTYIKMTINTSRWVLSLFYTRCDFFGANNFFPILSYELSTELIGKIPYYSLLCLQWNA